MPIPEIHKNVSLQAHTSLNIPARANWFTEVTAVEQLPRLLETPYGTRPMLVLGEGSNCLFTQDYDGLVAKIALRGIEILENDRKAATLRVAAGENWHAFVRWSLEQGLAGLENLALIPGTVGAAPIQNIGAYGVEVDSVIESVEVLDTASGGKTAFDRAECDFAYRDSLFKRQPGSHIVTAVVFRLPKQGKPVLHYAGLRERLQDMGVNDPTPADIADAVESLRREKLPDPARLGNAGSFFKNPVVTTEKCRELVEQHPDMPHFDAPDGVKLSAGWLIEKAGMKGYREGDAGISERHALVLVNHGEATGEQLWSVAGRVRETVNARFGILLEPEPRVF